MTTTRRPPSTGLPDATVERVCVAVVQLTGRLGLGDTCALLTAARRRHRRGETAWPETVNDVAAELAHIRRRHLLHLVELPPVLAAARTTCPSGAA